MRALGSKGSPSARVRILSTGFLTRGNGFLAGCNSCGTTLSRRAGFPSSRISGGGSTAFSSSPAALLTTAPQGTWRDSASQRGLSALSSQAITGVRSGSSRCVWGQFP
ncbi:hypothetical protein E2C01_021548 [Portunus trituberculatus]|uniref:Uncharacterized protein n=1 Tax=Portunus trituberculatus TaxID=210409 RepID=A0A5B7E585_PORTR|nr:hypothetical protein [Portunus trituberculatus]